MSDPKALRLFEQLTGRSSKKLHEAKVGRNGSLPPEQQKIFVDALLQLDKLSPYLEEFSPEKTEGGISTFARAWFLYAAATELLKYSIEDDLVDLSEFGGFIEPLEDLLDGDQWISPELDSFFRQLYELPNKKRVKTNLYLLKLIVDGIGVVSIPGRLSRPNEPEIPVSSARFPFVPILEEGIASHDYAQAIIQAYVLKLRPIIDRYKITHLCFIEKSVGPVGALGLLAALTEHLKLPAFVYRSGHWPQKSKLSGSVPRSINGKVSVHPNEESRVVLVYDLLVTGGALIEAALDLKTRFRTQVESAVVLFGYNKSLHEDNGYCVERNGVSIKLNAIGWYEDFAEDIRQIYRGELQSTNSLVPLNPTGRRSISSPAVSGELVRIPSQTEGGDKMEPSLLTRFTKSYIDRRVEEVAPIDKWGYSILAGVITFAYTQEPGGLSGIEGFCIAFVASFVILACIDIAANRFDKKNPVSHQ